MVTALTYLGVSLGICLFLTLLYVIEDVKGQRVFLKRAREKLDAVFLKILEKLFACTSFFTHGFMRLLLHYSAHKVLKQILLTLKHLEQKVENLVRHNRRIAKTIKEEAMEKTHLQAIAEHKQEVALTDEEKAERRAQ